VNERTTTRALKKRAQERGAISSNGSSAAGAFDSTGPYRIEGGRIVKVRQTKEGPITEPLCNFTAEVTEEILLDDGAEATRAFVVDGRLDTGQILPSIRIPASRFSANIMGH
jgi:hypothetical protein